MELTGIKHLMTRGETIKEEKVKTIVRNILPDTLVLENYEPFPGYFGGNLPSDIKPMSVFIVLAKEYDIIQISRVMEKIASARPHACDGTTANIMTRHGNLFCIRIKNLSCFEDISEIQQAFKGHNFEMARRREIDETVIITVQKTFFLENIENGIFKDLKEESQYYFLPGFIGDWKYFKELTSIVKQNIPNSIFDAAFGYFWTTTGLKDVIRIYERNNSVERVREIWGYYARGMRI